MSRDPGPSSPSPSTAGIPAPAVRVEAKMMVLLIMMTALALALIAGIVAYAVSNALTTALAWGGSTFAFVIAAGPPLVKMWRHGP
ncbi:hypothetical protein AB0O75_43750 [Streptomyces sp. NPDC088921]|uniref:hypothetical protein n=1 Tax=unclassified Streptomyces TaxID=2593676 RepID=UPI0034406646